MPRFLVKVAIKKLATLYIEEEIEADCLSEASFIAEEVADIANESDVTEYDYETMSFDVNIESMEE